MHQDFTTIYFVLFVSNIDVKHTLTSLNQGHILQWNIKDFKTMYFVENTLLSSKYGHILNVSIQRNTLLL